MIALAVVLAIVPRALFLTTSSDGNGTLPLGAHLVLEAFGGLGRPVKFSDASILYFPDSLRSYSVIVVPTIFGYHDGDRLYSLTYLDTFAMRNLTQWVKQGGLLIASENIGRNTPDGTDRIIDDGKLTRNEWPLGYAFGFDMVERSIQGMRLVKCYNHHLPFFNAYPKELRETITTPEWILVPDTNSILESVEVLAEWRAENLCYPGITFNRYGKGYAMYISSFLLLHPSFDGGYGDIPAIISFYKEIYRFLTGVPDGVELAINPWPDGARAALVVTLNETGTTDEYQRTISKLLELVPTVTVFVKGSLAKKQLTLISRSNQIELGNHGYSCPSFRDLPYGDTKREILVTHNLLDTPNGFRFPHAEPTPYGLMVLDELSYLYESSIIVNHLETFMGALFPYNLVVYTPERYVKTLNLLEISPITPDYSFYYKLDKSTTYTEHELKQDADAFYSYLNMMWRIIRDARGVMVQMGCPLYEGHSDVTLEPLLRFLHERKQEPAIWFANLTQVGTWWRALSKIDAEIKTRGNIVTIKLHNRNNHTLDRFTLRFYGPYLKTAVKSKGTKPVTFWRDESDGRYLYVVFNLKKEAEITFVLK